MRFLLDGEGLAAQDGHFLPIGPPGVDRATWRGNEPNRLPHGTPTPGAEAAS